ncbi:MAG: flagellar hook-associated protein FlgL [Candidatus Latescibacterota bacterium]
MRVTDKILQNNFTSNLSFATERLYERETRVLTQKSINKPSDNPVDAMVSLSLRSKMSEIEQFRRNIARSQTLLQNTETVITEVGDFFDRVNTLTIQGASDNYGSDDKLSISYEVDQILEQVFTLANNRSESIYTFAGTNNDTAPYQAIRNEAGEIIEVKTAGSAGDINTLIGESITLKVNINGEDIFEGDLNLFNILISVRDNLRVNDSDALRDDLIQLNSASEKIINFQSVLGARSNRINAADARAENDTITFTEYLSNTEDVDAAQAIMDYQMELVTLQSSLQAGSRLLYPKLSDFLK